MSDKVESCPRCEIVVRELRLSQGWMFIDERLLPPHAPSCEVLRNPNRLTFLGVVVDTYAKRN